MKSVCFISLFYPQLLTVHIDRYADRQTVGPPPPPHPILTPIPSPSPPLPLFIFQKELI